MNEAAGAVEAWVGSAYAHTARDSQGRYLDGGKTYEVTLPAPIPAGRFWPFSIYDNQTRSLLETDQNRAGSRQHTSQPEGERRRPGNRDEPARNGINRSFCDRFNPWEAIHWAAA